MEIILQKKYWKTNINRIFVPEKQWEVDVYNSYADFIQNLYEYIIGCFKRDSNSLKDISYKISDALIVREAEKYRKQCLWQIDQKNEMNHGLNDRIYYEEPIPVDFGEKFRNARNMNVHSDTRRVSSGFMADYFSKYHKFTLYIFFLGYQYWGSQNTSSIDLEDISKFARLIIGEKK